MEVICKSILSFPNKSFTIIPEHREAIPLHIGQGPGKRTMNHKKIKAIVCFGVLAIVMLAGCSSGQGRTQEQTDLVFGQQADSAFAQPELQGEQVLAVTEVPQVIVFVCGAVLSPGVVELPEDSRVLDALEAAGGFTADASRDYLNLARLLTDGEKLYFPTVAEAAEWAQQEAVARSGLVDINTAGASGLCSLPGIGDSRAADIIRYREENGPFATIEDLQRVDCITENIYSKLADKITVGY